ncbi:MAG TPA: LapA family protein [Oxalicibacterium sp.]|nr:LapA family protein [Oxalicibacterium sp.]
MRIWTLLLVVVLAATGAFAALNWDAFNAPTPLWLGVASVQAPLGMLMLGAMAMLTVLFLLAIGHMQSLALLEARRYAKELQANRELADRAEASRFTELRHYLEATALSANTQDAEAHAALVARLEQLETAMTASIEQTGNSLAAYIGEMEDRLEQNSATLTGR